MTYPLRTSVLYGPGPPRATSGLGETFSQGLQTFLRGPSREKNFEVFLFKMVYSDVFLRARAS